MTISFKDKDTSGTAYDTGVDQSAAIRPPANGESANETVLGRSLDHLRRRTEEVKRSYGNDQYFENILRGLTRSVVSIDNSGVITENGVYSLTVEGSGASKAYFFHPGGDNSSDDRIIVSGALERGAQYNLNRAAFNDFYTSGAGGGNLPNRGLQSMG